MIRSLPPQTPHHAHGTANLGKGFSPGGRMGLHGMVTFGDPRAAVFMSHIPMFHVPHDVQALFEVRVPDSVPTKNAETFTFKPEPFPLDDLVLGRLKTIRGTLFRGNFEHPGSQPVAELTAEVRRVVFAEPLDEHGNANAPLEYRLIGTSENAFLVHTVARGATAQPPDFDQVLSVKLPAGLVSDAEMTAGVTLTVPNRINRPSARLKLGEVELKRRGNEQPLTVRVLHELSFLVGPDFTSSGE